MDKINFENLPSTNTPLDADTLNGMQSNIEKSVVAVSKTQPSTSENVWIKKGKNWFDNTFYQIRNGIISDVRLESKKIMIKDKINIPQAISLSNDLDLNTYKWAVNIKTDRGTIDYDSDWINTNSWTVSQSEISEYVLRGNAEIYFVVAKTDDSDINVSEMDNYNFQIEVGTTATTLEPYIIKEILVKNDNGVYEEFYTERQKNKSFVLLYAGGISNTTDTLTYSGNISNYDKLIIQLGSTLEGDSKIIEIASQRNVINTSAYLNAFVNNYYNCGVSVFVNNNEVQMKGRQLTGWSAVPIEIFGVTR